MNSYPKKYFPNLDALRFFAFVLVFLEHMVVTNDATMKSSSLFTFYTSHFQLASVGVDFFIVLSGFLITWIVLEEYQHTSSFNLSFFWLRRCLRIWPLYFILVIVGYILVMGATHYYGASIHDMPPLAYLLSFTLNFYIANHGTGFLYCIAILWSISMEEQFYIVWGLVLKYVKTFLPIICYLLLALSIAFRIIYIHDAYQLYYNSLNWVGNFAIGSLLAYYASAGKLSGVKSSAKTSAIVYFLSFISLAFYNTLYSSEGMTITERLISSLFFIYILFEQCFSESPLFNPSASSKLSYLGKISYGLFAYHGFVILGMSKLLEHFGVLNVPVIVFLINPLITFALTVSLAAISYKYIEKPVMRLRYKVRTA